MTTSMLPEVWQVTVHGETIHNAERLARGAMRAHGVSDLSNADFDECLAYLLAELWRLTEKYEPRPGIRLEPWVYERLRRHKIIDWRRQWEGRHGEKRAVNQRDLSETEADDTEPQARRGSGAAVGEVPRDSADAWPDAVRGLLAGRDREVLQQVEALGLSPAGRARGGAAGADRGKARAA